MNSSSIVRIYKAQNFKVSALYRTNTDLTHTSPTLQARAEDVSVALLLGILQMGIFHPY